MFDMSITIPVRLPCQMSLAEIAAMIDHPFIRELRKEGKFLGNTFSHIPLTSEISTSVNIADPLLIRITNIHLDMDGTMCADIDGVAAHWKPYMNWNIFGMARVIGNPLARIFKLITIDCIVTPPKT